MEGDFGVVEKRGSNVGCMPALAAHIPIQLSPPPHRRSIAPVSRSATLVVLALWHFERLSPACCAATLLSRMRSHVHSTASAIVTSCVHSAAHMTRLALRDRTMPAPPPTSAWLAARLASDAFGDSAAERLKLGLWAREAKRGVWAPCVVGDCVVAREGNGWRV
jgi:hypothetical protein